MLQREREKVEEMSISKVIVVVASIYLAEKKKKVSEMGTRSDERIQDLENLSSDWLVKFAAWDFLYLYNKLDIDTESKTITTKGRSIFRRIRVRLGDVFLWWYPLVFISVQIGWRSGHPGTI